MQLTYQDLRKSEIISTYIKKADESLIALGYTEHNQGIHPYTIQLPNQFLRFGEFLVLQDGI